MHREVRIPTPMDLDRLQQIEEASDSLFEELVGPELFGEDDSGHERAASPGFLLVVAEESGAETVGFVHVLEQSGHAHLEQLSVTPHHGRRGHGRALTEAAMAEAARRGYPRITLRTYAHVSWNQPFYETCGFEVIPPLDDPFFVDLERTEHELGLFVHGDRVLMAAELGSADAGPGRPRACAIVLRDAEVLLMERMKDSEHYAVLPGGGIDPGESAHHAALRELTEETGLRAREASYLDTIDDAAGRTYYFLARDAQGEPELGGPELERSSPANVYRPTWVPLTDLGMIPLRPASAAGVIAAATPRHRPLGAPPFCE